MEARDRRTGMNLRDLIPGGKGLDHLGGAYYKYRFPGPVPDLSKEHRGGELCRNLGIRIWQILWVIFQCPLRCKSIGPDRDPASRSTGLMN